MGTTGVTIQGYGSEAERDAVTGWDEGDLVYVSGLGYTFYDGAAWQSVGVGSKDFYAQDTDPGAVGAGSVWKDTSSGNFWNRNEADDEWEPRFALLVTATAAVMADVRATAYSEDGDVYAGLTAYASGDGSADVNAGATATNGTAYAGSIALRGAASAGMSAVVDGTSARMAFNGTTPIVVPVIPAVPDAQDIADVLVALGLVTQSP